MKSVASRQPPTAEDANLALRSSLGIVGFVATPYAKRMSVMGRYGQFAPGATGPSQGVTRLAAVGRPVQEALRSLAALFVKNR